MDTVQATAVFGFAEAYHRYVTPLSVAEKDRAFAEAVPAAHLYGAIGAPNSWAKWEGLLRDTSPQLEGSAIIAEFLDIMETCAILPRPLRWLQRLHVRAAVEITPEPVRSLPQLQGRGLRSGEAILLRSFGALARHAPLASLPPALAAKRLVSKSIDRQPSRRA